MIIDKDTTNWVDFLAELDAEVKHGEQQELHILFWDKTINEYVWIASDAALLDAFAQYWELRRLPLQVFVHDTEPSSGCRFCQARDSSSCFFCATTFYSIAFNP
jgi:hypothetical protein